MVGGSSTNAERLTRLEEFVGTPLATNDSTLANHVHNLHEGLGEVKTLIENMSRANEAKFIELFATAATSADLMRDQMQKMSNEITILKRAVAGGASSGSLNNHSKFKVPEPKSFGGSRNTKVLENFLWDMEQYFKASHISENEIVTINGMYLLGDAKLWWRTRMDDDGMS